MRFVNDQKLGVICSLPRIIVSFITSHEIFRLLYYTSVNLVLGSLAVRQMMKIDWFAPECAPWFSYRLETGETIALNEYVYFLREYGRSTEQLFLAVRATACDPFMTVEAVREELGIYYGEADFKANIPSSVASPPVAGSDGYDADEICDGDLNDGDWCLKDADSTPEVLVLFTHVRSKSASRRYNGRGVRPDCSCSTLFRPFVQVRRFACSSG